MAQLHPYNLKHDWFIIAYEPAIRPIYGIIFEKYGMMTPHTLHQFEREDGIPLVFMAFNGVLGVEPHLSQNTMNPGYNAPYGSAGFPDDQKHDTLLKYMPKWFWDMYYTSVSIYETPVLSGYITNSSSICLGQGWSCIHSFEEKLS